MPEAFGEVKAKARPMRESLPGSVTSQRHRKADV